MSICKNLKYVKLDTFSKPYKNHKNHLNPTFKNVTWVLGLCLLGLSGIQAKPSCPCYNYTIKPYNKPQFQLFINMEFYGCQEDGRTPFACQRKWETMNLLVRQVLWFEDSIICLPNPGTLSMLSSICQPPDKSVSLTPCTPRVTMIA